MAYYHGNNREHVERDDIRGVGTSGQAWWHLEWSILNGSGAFYVEKPAPWWSNTPSS
jgi:hypothetical protein